MSYTKVQLAAYEVPTGAALPAGQCTVNGLKICQGVQNDDAFKAAYGGLSDDARPRVSRLLNVADAAWESKAARTARDTLKIFMAPEFYLRPREQGTAYRSYEVTDMVAAQELFRIVFSQAQLQDWMFVLGTIVWNMKGKVAVSKVKKDAPQLYVKRLENLANQDLVYNTAIVAVGGVGVQLYDKVHYSSADEIRDERSSLKTYCMQSSTQNLLSAGNVWCGLEVCYDHQLGQLGKNYGAFKKSWGGKDAAPQLDLQLLTACGMTVQKRSVILDKQRCVFRVDGAIAESPEGHGRFDHSEIQVVTEAGQEGAVSMVDPATDLDAWKKLNTPDDSGVLSGDLKVDPTGAKGYLQPTDESQKGISVVEKDLDDVFKQRLVVYPVVDLVHLS